MPGHVPVRAGRFGEVVVGHRHRFPPVRRAPGPAAQQGKQLAGEAGLERGRHLLGAGPPLGEVGEMNVNRMPDGSLGRVGELVFDLVSAPVVAQVVDQHHQVDVAAMGGLASGHRPEQHDPRHVGPSRADSRRRGLGVSEDRAGRGGTVRRHGFAKDGAGRDCGARGHGRILRQSSPARRHLCPIFHPYPTFSITDRLRRPLAGPDAARLSLSFDLSERAEAASGRPVEVFVTDWPEWRQRISGVSSSFEASIAPHAVALVERPAGAVRWNKEIGLPDTNQTEALGRLDEAAKALRWRPTRWRTASRRITTSPSGVRPGPIYPTGPNSGSRTHRALRPCWPRPRPN